MFYGYLQMGQSEDERCEQIHHHLAQLIKKKRTSIGLSGIGNAWSASFDNFSYLFFKITDKGVSVDWNDIEDIMIRKCLISEVAEYKDLDNH